MADMPISFENTADVTYDPHDEKYWDESSLRREINRTFDLCHSCRMCFKFCPSFPDLFGTMDGHADGDVHKFTEADIDRVEDKCFQCKLCYVQCPYTDQDNHKYDLNFPALMQRRTNVRAKKSGVGLREKVLQNADMAGKMNTGFISRIVNATMKPGGFHRRVFQALLGVHKDKLMPEFHRASFMRWWKNYKKKKDPAVAGSGEKVALFATCFVIYNNPRLGKECVDVLEHNDLDVVVPPQNCCGMPGIESGDLKFALKKMKRNVESLYPLAKEGYKILAINPTCSLTLKQEYMVYLEGELREKARVVSAAVRDVHEYLFELKGEDKLKRDFKSTPGKVGYHVPCHLRAQNIGFRSRDIMKLIPGAKILPVAECCGHDGTWAMKTENFEMSLDTGKRAFEGLKESNPDRVSTDCPLAALQLEQGGELKERPEHPVQILYKAYRAPAEGGFSEPVPPGGD